MYTHKSRIGSHIKNHATIYIFMIILFLTGIVFGAIIVNSMNFVQKQDLYFYLERFFKELSTGETIDHRSIFVASSLYHIKYLLIMFILGLSVIGLPIIWIFLFLKGLVVGFSVGFIVNQLGLKGLLLSAISIAPQNIIIIPIYIIASTLAMVFSLALLNKLFAKSYSEPIWQPFKRYAFVYAILLVISLVAAGLETFVANEAMQLIVKSFYK